MKESKKTIVAILDGKTSRENVKDEKKNLADIDDKSFLTFLEDDESLILSEPKNPSMTWSVLLEIDFN